MLIALAVVLAAVLLFWLTGDKGPKSGKTRGDVERREGGKAPAGRGDPDEAGETPGESEKGKKKPIPGWKRAMPRPRDREGEEDAPARELEEKPSRTPHAPGAPQR
jgi:hypothetical protein